MKLRRLYDEFGQSPWLDNLRRDWIVDGTLAEWVRRGVRGVTSNPTIFQKAIAGSDAYDEQFRHLIGAGHPAEDAYWDLVCRDITDACAMLADVHERTEGEDGFVSLEVAPDLARDAGLTLASALDLARRVGAPNLMIKIPGTAEGLPAIRDAVAAGLSINVTLLFSVARYAEVIDAVMTGLETRLAEGGSVAAQRSVASFFVSRVDTEVDRRLDALGTAAAAELKGLAAIANARLAYQEFDQAHATARWRALAARGAHVQRPLWASTSTKNPALPDTLYVDELIGPYTVNTLPETTLTAFDDHGTLKRTLDLNPSADAEVMASLAEIGIDLDDVTRVLEDEGVASFQKSFDELLSVLRTKAEHLI